MIKRVKIYVVIELGLYHPKFENVLLFGYDGAVYSHPDSIPIRNPCCYKHVVFAYQSCYHLRSRQFIFELYCGFCPLDGIVLSAACSNSVRKINCLDIFTGDELCRCKWHIVHSISRPQTRQNLAYFQHSIFHNCADFDTADMFCNRHGWRWHSCLDYFLESFVVDKPESRAWLGPDNGSAGSLLAAFSFNFWNLRSFECLATCVL